MSAERTRAARAEARARLDAGRGGLGRELLARDAHAAQTERRLAQEAFCERARPLRPVALLPALEERSRQGERVLGPQRGVLRGIAEDVRFEMQVAPEEIAPRITRVPGAGRAARP
jgi:hypothetical protein